jgi:hypothetical protein
VPFHYCLPQTGAFGKRELDYRVLQSIADFGAALFDHPIHAGTQVDQ